MKCYHDSQDLQYRNPFGAIPAGNRAILRLRVSATDGSPLSCRLHLWRTSTGGKELPMECEEQPDGTLLFSISSVISEEPDLCWYYFILENGNQKLYYGNNAERLGGEGCLSSCEPPAFQITVYRPAAVPTWYKNAIVYQIFPDRFARGEDWRICQMLADHGSSWKGPRRVIQQDWNDVPYYTRNAEGEITRWPFFGGTLQGIRSKLFYLKSLGVGAIYLNPIFTASSNHKYDTADYMSIDPSFGTVEDFRMLAQDARQLGIRLILDGVFNHTGADSIYFNALGNYDSPGACQGPESPYYSWYRFTDFPTEYDCWWGVKNQPNLEESDPSYQRFLYGDENSVIRRWLREGASGWRLDVADELPDPFIAGIRRAVKETDPDGLLLGEVWEDASNKISYDVQRRYFLGDELDSTMNYPVRELLTDFILGRSVAENAVRKLRSLSENYPPENFYGALNLIGSHDRMRILTMLGDPPEGLSDLEKECYRLPEEKRRLAVSRLKILSLFQYVLPGVPCLYYGDEAGAEGYEDPYNRGTYPWGREDEELLSHFRTLALLRKQHALLTTGAYRFSWEGEHVLICERYAAEKKADADSGSAAGARIIAVINRNIFGNACFTLSLPENTSYVLELLSSQVMTVESASSDEPSADKSHHCLTLDMPPMSAQLFYCSAAAPSALKLARSAGVLCHISSLPSGKLDKQAEAFIDYLAASGQKLWQILPLNPPEKFSGSPYSSPSVFAGNPGLIDPISDLEEEPSSPYNREAYEAFCKEEAYWLDDYALYTVIKSHFRGAAWQQWPQAERNRENLDLWRTEHAETLDHIKKEQFRFHTRWMQVKSYANEKGISIIGDIPVYAGVDSADTWAHREAFLLNEKGFPVVDAGVPPDYFSESGQHWKNPLYHWEQLKKTGYDWWLQRIAKAMKQYDYIRLDHFRSFSAFFAIPFGKTPRDGWWLPGAGTEFFDFLESKLGALPILAEDLGLLDAQVSNLLKLTGYPGMMVYQFSADEMETMPKCQAASRVFYSGTHDNQTLVGWCKENRYEKTPDEIIRTLYESEAPWVILPLQDLLGLDDEHRMNVPGQIKGNWSWQANAALLTEELAARLKDWASQAGR